MSVLKRYNTATAQWETVVVGRQGPTGPQGIQGETGPQGGFDSTQIIETKAANYSLLATDAGKLMLNSAAITITVEGIEVGKQVDFLQATADQITFAAGAGVTLNSKGGLLATKEQGSPASIKCVATGVYWLVGDLA